MAKSKRKLDSKAFAHQKRQRRKWITFLRMCRYGVNNFSRNAWLTVAATAVMTITLCIVFASIVARNILVDTVVDFRSSVTMSIYTRPDADQASIDKVQSELKNLSTVTDVQYITPAQARQEFIDSNANNRNALSAVTEATNLFPGTFRIKLVDINDTTQLSQFVETNQDVKNLIPANRPPSFAGERRATIENIGRVANFVLQVGIVGSIIFITVSTLIIFNTIRMAIFNRREEINMMKLIGAEKSFIRGPFIVEAIVYGFIAAVIATTLGYITLIFISPSLDSYDVAIGPTTETMIMYLPFVVIGMILIGAFIGIISSLLATRRYLKL